jgi:hypothetical protein
MIVDSILPVLKLTTNWFKVQGIRYVGAAFQPRSILTVRGWKAAPTFHRLPSAVCHVFTSNQIPATRNQWPEYIK